MKKVFTHENRMIVFNMKNLLQGEGIDSFVINEFASGGAGDLATFDTWPELWIEDDARVQQAEQILQDVFSAGETGSWVCRDCQESNAAAFQICWNCGHPYE
jgi:hypothetical protein